MHQILIVEDHPLVGLGISLIVAETLPKAKIHHASTLAAALHFLENSTMTLIILDINVPGGGSTEMVMKLRERQNDVPILVSTGMGETHHVIDYCRAGVNGFISKTSNEEAYAHAILTVLSGGKYLSELTRKLIVEDLISGVGKPSGPDAGKTVLHRKNGTKKPPTS